MCGNPRLWSEYSLLLGQTPYTPVAAWLQARTGRWRLLGTVLIDTQLCFCTTRCLVRSDNVI
jgi:hypothetical protein